MTGCLSRPHSGGLARAIGTAESHHLSGRDLEAQLVKSRHAAEPSAQAVKLQQTGHDRGLRALLMTYADLADLPRATVFAAGSRIIRSCPLPPPGQTPDKLAAGPGAPHLARSFPMAPAIRGPCRRGCG